MNIFKEMNDDGFYNYSWMKDAVLLWDDEGSRIANPRHRVINSGHCYIN